MTASQKILIKKLLSGHFLRATKSKGKSCYVLYDAKVNPLEKIKARTVDTIDRLIDPEIKIWKKSKKYGNITLNLSMVRQLNGHHTIKRLYKQKDSLDLNDTIYKTRGRRKRIIKNDTNEKVHYLF